MSTIILISKRGYLTELTYCFCNHLLNKGKFKMIWGDDSVERFKSSIVSSFLNKKPSNETYKFILNRMYHEIYNIELLIAWKHMKPPRPDINMELDFKNKLQPGWKEWLTIRGYRGLNLKSITYFRNLARIYLYS